jgi:hypothetical protein
MRCVARAAPPAAIQPAIYHTRREATGSDGAAVATSTNEQSVRCGQRFMVALPGATSSGSWRTGLQPPCARTRTQGVTRLLTAAAAAARSLELRAAHRLPHPARPAGRPTGAAGARAVSVVAAPAQRALSHEPGWRGAATGAAARKPMDSCSARMRSSGTSPSCAVERAQPAAASSDARGL